jgi:glycosyltransferase involved in cell wall biosynthesis
VNAAQTEAPGSSSGKHVRVLYLSHAFMVGGAEEMVLNLVRHLPPRFEPAVGCIHHAGPIGEEIRRTGVPFEVLSVEPGWRRPLDVVTIRRYLARVRPTIVHTFLLSASLYGRLAAMLARVPIIIGTEVNIYAHKQAHHALAERLLLKGTDTVVASAESVRDFYIEQVHADPGKVEVIYNAVDWGQLVTSRPRNEMRRDLQVPEEPVVIGIIARLTKQKAHAVLFEAVAHTPALAQTHLVVVGDGELRNELEALALRLELSDRVHFLGARRDLGDLLNAIDIFAMPSYWEGLPLSMVLAMGAGLPVVATRVAGIPEVVRDGQTGLLVPAGDATALGSALARLAESTAMRHQLGAAAREHVRPRFGVDGYVAAVSALYDRLLAAKGLA